MIAGAVDKRPCVQREPHNPGAATREQAGDWTQARTTCGTKCTHVFSVVRKGITHCTLGWSRGHSGMTFVPLPGDFLVTQEEGIAAIPEHLPGIRHRSSDVYPQYSLGLFTHD